MRKKQRQGMEYRYYEIPADSQVLVLTGEEWKQNYGRDVDWLHFHNAFEIGYCYYGDGVMIFDEKHHFYRDDMFTLIPKNYPHATNSRGSNICYWEFLFFDVEKIVRDAYKDNVCLQERLIQRVNSNAHLISGKEEPQMRGLIRTIIEITRNKKEFYLEEAKGLILSLLLEIARYNKNDAQENEWTTVQQDENRVQHMYHTIAPALDFIRKNYMNEIKPQELADICHVSLSHFRRIFAETLHMTPNEYMHLVRIYAACDEMQRTRDSITTIAYRVGFMSISTFNRKFQQVIGISPQQWRKKGDYEIRKLLDYDVRLQA